jgi:acyl-CoA thioesterase
MSFAKVSAFAARGPFEHEGEIDAGWAQGPGAYGGLVAAILARALQTDAPRDQALVTMSTVFCAPATAGPARVRTEIVRTGRNVSTLRASMEREGVVLSTALATVARRRESTLAHDGLVMPTVPPPEQVPDGPEEHYIPPFTRAFGFRQCLGPVPFSGGSEARVGGWCRLEEDDVPVDAALVCAMLDAWPPAAVALSPGWCPVASIEIGYHFLAPFPNLSAERRPWLFHDASARYVSSGMADETAVLWSRDGRPLATARQLVAIFPPSARPDVKGAR